MIRQAINCDMCGAEKQATSYWFVAYEQNGEIKLKGWEEPQNSRKHVKHLCGQKCVQRIMANFMASVMANGHGVEGGKETAEALAFEPVRVPVEVETLAAVEAESWAGPVRAKESLWDVSGRMKPEREGFLHAARQKPATGRMQKMA